MWETLSSRRISRLEWALLLGILVLGAWLRFPQLGRESLWGDEINLAEVALLPSVRDTVSEVQLPHSAGYPVFLHFWMKLGRGDAYVRVPSVISGLIAIGLLYFAARKIGGTVIGAIAALFLAVSEEQVRFSREAAAYSPQNAVILGAFLVWLTSLEKNRWRDWIGLAVLCSVSHHLHPLASTTLVGWYLLVPFGWLRGVSMAGNAYSVAPRSFSLFRWLVSGLALGVSILPQTLKNLEGARRNIGSPEGGASVGDLFLQVSHLLGSGAAPFLLIPFGLIGAIVLFRGSLFLGLSVAVWSAGTVVVWAIFSWTQATHFDYHYFVSHLPAFLLFAAFGTGSLGLSPSEGRIPRQVVPAILALAAAVPMGYGSLLERDERRWPQYRQAGIFLVQHLGPGDRYYVKPEGWIQNKIGYYVSEIADQEVGVEVFFNPERQEEMLEEFGTFFIVTRHPMPKDSNFASEVFRGVVINWKETRTEPPLDFAKVYDWTLASGDKVSPDDLLFEARNLENAGELESALQVINRALEMAPHYFWVVRKRAEILDGLDRYQEAAAAFEAAEKIAPKEWAWWMAVSRAENLSEAGESQTAIQILKEVLAESRKEKDQALVWEVLGGCLAREGAWEQARAAYEKTLDLWKVDRFQTLLALGELSEEEGNREEAIQFYRRAAAFNRPEKALAEKRLAELEGETDPRTIDP